MPSHRKLIRVFIKPAIMKFLALFIFSLLLSVVTVGAQLREVSIDTRGNFEMTLELGNNQYIVVTGDGYIVDWNLRGRAEYNERSIFEEQNGLLKRVGNVEFEYYDRFTTFDEAMYGKVRKAGNISFEYYDLRGFYPEKYGKVEKAGQLTLEYYDNGAFDREQTGKIKKLGPVTFSYYTRIDAMWPGNVPADQIAGMLRSVGSHEYRYTPGRGSSRDPMPRNDMGMEFERRPDPGALRTTGPRQVTVNGIRIRVRDYTGRPR